MEMAMLTVESNQPASQEYQVPISEHHRSSESDVTRFLPMGQQTQTGGDLQEVATKHIPANRAQSLLLQRLLSQLIPGRYRHSDQWATRREL